MKKLLLLFLIVATMAGCSSSSSVISKISPKKAMELLDARNDIVFIDVRTQEEYQTGYAKGSILIPLDQLSQQVSQKVKDFSTPILLICRSGNRSNEAAKLLKELGYLEIYDVGGILDWPYPLITPTQ